MPSPPSRTESRCLRSAANLFGLKKALANAPVFPRKSSTSRQTAGWQDVGSFIFETVKRHNNGLESAAPRVSGNRIKFGHNTFVMLPLKAVAIPPLPPHLLAL